MRATDIEQAAPALDHRALDLLVSGDDSWSFALERVRKAGGHIPIALDAATLERIAEWARQTRPAADRAEHWAWRIREVISEWSDAETDDEEEAECELDEALGDIEDISDDWDIEHPEP